MKLRTSQKFNLIIVTCILILLPSIIFFIQTQQQTQQQAAQTVVSPPTLGGCNIFPSNNVWNFNISGLITHNNSANFINMFAHDQLIPYFGTPETSPSDLHYDGIPYVVVPATQPNVPVKITDYAYESDPGPYPIPSGLHTEEHYDLNSIDHHAEIVQSGTCKLYELYGAHENADKSWTLLGGAVWDLKSNAIRGSAPVDAAGFPILAGLVKYDEVASGQVNHAFRFLLKNTQNAHIWPAIAHDGSMNNPNVPPEGLRLRLKSSVDISSFPPESKVILQTLKTYGMILADQGGESGTVMLSGAPDTRWNLQDLASLNKIHFSDFEAVDESKLMVSPNSAEVNSSYLPVFSTVSPTQIVNPSPTGGVETINMEVTVCPQGLGNCGDVLINHGGNGNPQHQQRNIIITFVKGMSTTTNSGIVHYVPGSGNFQGTIPVKGLMPGQYSVKISMQGFLTKEYPNKITAITGQTLSLPMLALVNGDINNDNLISILDYNAIMSCFGSKFKTASCLMPATSQYSGADIDDDGVVDGADYNLFLREWRWN